MPGNEAKFVTIHSRRAEGAVLEMLAEEYPHPCGFHWTSGNLKSLSLAIERGHFFSINPACVAARKGRAVIEQIPKERTLTDPMAHLSRLGQKQWFRQIFS